MNKQKLLILSFVLVVTCLLYANPPDWEVISGTQYNMIVYADAQLFEQPFNNDNPDNILAAFGPNGETDCRGIGEFWSVPDSTGTTTYEFWYITVVSDAGFSVQEQITFRIYNDDDDQVYVCQSNIPVIFYNDYQYGILEEPVHLFAPPNPVAVEDYYSIDEDNSLTVSAENGVLANDYDPVDTLLTADFGNYPLHGNIIFNENDGSFNYTPDEHFYGDDIFSYRAFDGMYYSDFVSVYITVNPVNDPPEINLPGSYSFNEDSILEIDFGSYISDIDSSIDDMYLVAEPAEYIEIDIDTLSVTLTPDLNWNGSELLTFTVYDYTDDTLNSSDSVIVNVIPVNDPPVFTDLLPVSFTFEEDLSLSVDFSDFIYDIDGDMLTLTSSAGTNVFTEIDGYQVTFTASENWYGSENLSFRIEDPSGSFEVSDQVAISVTPVNDTPEINLPEEGFNFDEDNYITVNFSPFLSDIDGDQLSLSSAGNDTIHVTINYLNVLFSSTVVNWNGSEDIIFTVNDNQGRAMASDTVTVYVNPVNDPPVITFADTIRFDEDSSLQFDFAPYISDPEDDQIHSLFVSNNQNINIAIDGLIVNFSSPANWYGNETVTFTVSDEFASDSQNIRVEVIPVNDPPVRIDQVDDYTLDEDFDPETIILSDFFNDIDGDTLTYYAESNDAGIITEINNSEETLTFYTIEHWNGNGTITVTASDDSASVSDIFNLSVIPVNDPPVIELPAIGFEFDEDESLIADFSQYIGDVDEDDLTLSVEQGQNIFAEIAGSQVTFTALENWFGSESLLFTVSDNQDRLTASDIVTITVNQVVDPPVIELPDLGFSFDEDETLTFDFAEYLTLLDIPFDFMTASGNENISVDINNTSVTFSAAENWNGSEMITFTIQDTSGAVASDSALVTVNPVNDDPVIILPDSFTFDEDESLTVDFAPFISDIDEDILTLDYIPGQYVTADINEFEVTFSASDNWYGSEDITFTVNDNMGRAIASDDVTVIVTPVDDLPSINLPDSFTFNEDGNLIEDFSQYIVVPDSPLDFISFTENENINVAVDEQMITFSAEENWFGSEFITFTIQDIAEQTDSDSVLVIVEPVNDPPQIILPDSFTFVEDGSLNVDFSIYLSDIENDELMLYANSGDNVIVDIDSLSVTFTAAENWFGSEFITFTVDDMAGRATNYDMVEIIVTPENDPPQIILPENFTFNEDESLTRNFNNYINDVDEDNVILSVQETQNIEVVIDGFFVTFTTYEENWNGIEMIEFTVSDSETRLSTSDTVNVIVNPVNDPPEINLPDIISFDEDEIEQRSFAEYLNDVDGDDLTLSYTPGEDINVEIIGFDVTFSADENWNGSEYIEFFVRDNQTRASAYDTLLVIVNPVNDDPVIDIPDEYSFLVIDTITDDFSSYVDDVDEDSLSLYVSDNVNVNVDIDGFIVTFSSIDNWTGSEYITFTVDDNQGRAVSSDMTLVTVYRETEPPVIELPASIVIDEDEYIDVDFSQYISDPNNDELVLTTDSYYEDIDVEIVDLMVTFTPAENWFGSEYFTFFVSDSVYTVSDSVNFIVNPVNDPPVIERFPQEFVFESGETRTENLEEYFFDIDNSLDELELSVTGNDSIDIIIDGYNVTFITPPDSARWQGVETVTFTIDDGLSRATDSAQTDLVVTENLELPFIHLPDNIIMNEDVIRNIDFDDYIYNDDGYIEYDLNVTGAQNLMIDIDQESHIVSFSSTANWFGEETLTFSIVNPDEGLDSEDQTTVIVNPVDDPPVIDLPQAGYFNFNEDTFSMSYDFSLNLEENGFVFDVDDSLVTVTIEPADPLQNISVDFTDYQAVFSAVLNFNGTESFNITVSDDEFMVEDSFPVTVNPVNDLPIINLPVSYEFDEDTQSETYNFSQYITEIDGDDYILNRVDAVENITVNITGTDVTFFSPLNWNGQENIVFSVNDGQGEGIVTDTVLVIVNPVNDPPIIDLPEEGFSFAEDSNLNEDFAEYATDIDGDPLLITFEGNVNISVEVNEMMVSFSALENWNGQEDIVFTVNDNQDRITDSDTVTVVVTPVNDAPEIDLPDEGFNFDEDNDLLVDFSEYINDIDLDDLVITNSLPTNIDVEINGFMVTLSTMQENWFGNETLTFTVNDQAGRATASDQVLIVVNPVNDVPEITLPDSRNFNEDSSLTINFDQFINDIDDDLLTLTVSGQNNVMAEIDNENYDVTFSTMQENWNGQETLTFTVSDNQGRATASDQILIIVNPVNDAPTINIPPNLSFAEDNSATLDFENYIDDIDGDELDLSVAGNVNIHIEFNDYVVTFTTENANWNGSETLTFTVNDNQGRATASDQILITVTPVNDPPAINLPASYTFVEDGSLTRDLTALVSDIDGDALTLEVTGGVNVFAEVSGFEVTFTSTANWNGSENLTFTVEDPDGLTASDIVQIIVTPANDAPSIVLPANFNFVEDGSLNVDFSNYIDDIDEDILTITVANNVNIQVEIDAVSVTFSTVEENWNGSETLEFTVNDNQGRAVASDEVIVNVSRINDAPTIELPDQFETILEDDYLTKDFAEFVDDIDGDSLSISCTGNESIGVFIDRLAVTLFPAANWFGQETLIFTVSDNVNRLTDSDTVLVIVESVNDAPVINLPISIVAIEDSASTHTRDFSEFIYDIDGDSLTLTAEQYTEIDDIIIDGLVVTFVDDDWDTTEPVLFTVSDADTSSFDISYITLIPEEAVQDPDAIVITLPNLDGMEFGQDFTMPVGVNLLLPDWMINQFFFNLIFDPAVLEFLGFDFEDTICDTTRSGRDLTTLPVESPVFDDYISGTGAIINLLFKYVSNEYEQAVVELEDFEFNSPGPGGNLIPVAIFDGVVNNDFPTLNDTLQISNQLLDEDFDPVVYNLNEYFIDNTPNSILEFSVSSYSEDFAVTIQDTFMHILPFIDKNTNSEPKEVVLVCYDKFLYSVRDTFHVIVNPVNDPPVLNITDAFICNEDDTLTVNFTEYISDVDNEIDDISIVSIESLSGYLEGIDIIPELSALFTAPDNWTGVDNLSITITDNEDEFSETLSEFTVTVVYTQPDDIHCYPNPMITDEGTKFVVNTVKELSSIEITVYDFAGREVCSQTSSGRGAQEIHWLGYNDWNNGNKLARGVYFARVVGRNQSGGIALEKVVKVAIKE